MRLLHPTTLKIASIRTDLPKTIISHCWSEIFKWLASGQIHPKMFITDYFFLGAYLSYIYKCGYNAGCNLDKNKIDNLPEKIKDGFLYGMEQGEWIVNKTYKTFYKNEWYGFLKFFTDSYFDENYLFSDACSLYYKGINIFPDIFGENWRKYVPVESYEEINRQLQKTIKKL